MNIYEKVKTLCDAEGITPREMEARTGLGYRSFDNWKKSSPSVENVLKVAKYFGCTIDSLARDEQATKQDRRYLHSTPEIKILLSATESLSKSDILMLADIARRMNDNGGAP